MIKKFRVWNERYKSYKEPLDDWDSEAIEVYDSPSGLLNAAIRKLSEDEDLIVEQFSGMLDAAGKEIYEGDIIECQNKKWEVKFKLGGYFLWNEGKNASDKSESWYLFTAQDKEILGNIHQNPELLT